MKRLKRLANNVGILICFCMIPVTFVLIDNYIHRPVAGAIGSGAILLAFRLLETAGALAVLLGLSVMMNKLSRSIARTFE